MAVRASNSITVYDQTDVLRVSTFYSALASTANPPAAPTTTSTAAAVDGWSATMPAYDSSQRCYKVERSERGDGTCVWGEVTEDQAWAGANGAASAAADAQSVAQAALSDSVEYIVGTQTAATGSWTGVTRDSTLSVGKTIAYKLPVAGNGSASLQLKDSNGSNVGGNVAVYSMTTRVTTHYPAGSVIQMSYDGTYWRTAGWYNTNTYDRRLHNNYVLAAGAVASGALACGTSAGYVQVAANAAFDLAYPILWAGAAWTSGTQYASAYEAYPSVNVAVMLDVAEIPGIAPNKVVYLKGAVSGNTFTVAASGFLTCTPPTGEDGFCYIPIGMLANDYSASATKKLFFSSSKELWAYKDGAFGPVSLREASAAAKTATSYIADFGASGMRVHPDGDTTDYAQIDANGMDVVKGGTSVASFGATARVGVASGQHIAIDSDSLDVMNGNAVTASFGEDVVELARLSKTAAVKMCGGGVVISSNVAPTGNEFYVQSETYKKDSNGDEVVDVVYDHPTGALQLLPYAIPGGSFGTTASIVARADNSSDLAGVVVGTGSDGMARARLMCGPLLNGTYGAIELQRVNGQSWASADADRVRLRPNTDFAVMVRSGSSYVTRFSADATHAYVAGMDMSDADTARASIGAASSSHTHDVSTGGTGRTTLTSGSYLVGNGTGSVTLKTPAQVLSDIEALPLSGGTLTGSLTVQGSVNAKSTSTYLTKIGSTYPSGNTNIGGGFQAYDSAGECTFYSQTIMQASGTMYRSLCAQRKDASGTNITHGHYLYIDADGTRRVSFTSPAAWRKGLAIGAATISLASNAATKTTSTKVALTGLVCSDTSLFSLSSNGIKCAAAGTVKVSGVVTISGSAGYNGGVAAVVYKGSTAQFEVLGHMTTNTGVGSASIAPKCIAVAANDVIYLYARTTTASTMSAGSTYLTVEYVA